jgi:hypothetical protein
MGHNGMGVSFGEAAPEEEVTPYAQNQNFLGVLLDDVFQEDFMNGRVLAHRAEAIERARSFTERLTREMISNTPLAARLDMAERELAAELGAGMRIPDRTARNLIETSRVLVTQLTETLAALDEGRLTYRHAQVLVGESRLLSPEAVKQLEAAVLPHALKMTASQFERKVRTTREKLHPESMVERQVAAEDERHTAVIPRRDGMGTYELNGPIVQITAFDNRVTAIARSKQTELETRTLAQLKFDVVSDILLDVALMDDEAGTVFTPAGEGDGPVVRYRSIRPRILVTVPALTLLKRSNEPATLEGYGPIDPDTARELTASAKSLTRLLTHPETGVVMSMGRKKYRIPAELRTWLRVRDGTCRFPGCSRNAMFCDLDHTDDFATGGATDHNNLESLCPGHHTLKHATGWIAMQAKDGSGDLRWTTPTGRTFMTTAATRVRP